MNQEQDMEMLHTQARQSAKARMESICSAVSPVLTDQGGSALIVVLCVMMIMVTICLSLLLAASALTATAKRSYAREQCRVMAESVSRKLGEELVERSYSGIPSGNPSGSSLWEYVGAYVCEKNNSWLDYDADGGSEHALSAVKRSFQLTDPDWPEDAGEITVGLYWVNGSGREWDGWESWEQYFHSIDIDLYIEVTCAIQQEACTRTNVYFKVSNEKEHTWKWSQRAERDGGEDR